MEDGGPPHDAGARRRRAVRRQVFLPRRARDPPAAPRRLAADRARRLLLGRPAGARARSRARASSSSSSRRTRRSTCPRSTRARSAASVVRDRPQPADARHPRRADEAPDPHAAVARRADDRRPRHRARQDPRAARPRRADARLLQGPPDLLRRPGEDAGGLRLGLLRPDHGRAHGLLRRPVPGRTAARW